MNDLLTTRLSRQLHEQVDDLSGPPLTLESVRGRARRMRRNRTLSVTAAAVVAVAAVAVPIGLLGEPSGRSDRAPEVLDSPNGAADRASGVGVPFLSEGTLTLPDSTQVTMPGGYQQLFAWEDGYVGVARDQDTGALALDRLTADGSLDASRPVTGDGIAVSSDTSAVAYVDRSGDLAIEGPDATIGLGRVGQVQPVRLLGGPDCSFGVDDCVVWFQDGETIRFLNNAGEGDSVAGLAVQDVSETGLMSVLTSVDEREPGSCSVVSNWREPRELYETCDHTPSRFSPDGSHLSALPPYLSGIGPSSMSILDAQTGAQQATIEPADGFVADGRAVWEDSDHLLVPVYSDGAWSVVRLGADGSQERVLGPVEGDELEAPWVLVGPPA